MGVKGNPEIVQKNRGPMDYWSALTSKVPLGRMAVVVSTWAITSRAALVERSMNDSGEQGGEAIAHVDATLIPVSVVGLGVPY